MKLKKFLNKNRKLLTIAACSLILPSIIAAWVIYMFYNCTDDLGCLIIFLPFTPGISLGEAIGIDLYGWPLIIVNWVFYMIIGALIGLIIVIIIERKQDKHKKLN